MHTQSITRTDVQTSVEGQCAVTDGNKAVLDGRWPRETDAIILHGDEQQPFAMAAAQAESDLAGTGMGVADAVGQ